MGGDDRYTEAFATAFSQGLTEQGSLQFGAYICLQI